MAFSRHSAKTKAPRPGRPLGQFTQARRLESLRKVLEENPTGLSLQQLAALLRVTQRSVRRYLEELEVSTELESVETSPGAHHIWRIKPSERGRSVPLRRTQAFALLATRRLFENTKGSALFDEVELAFRQVHQIALRPPALRARKKEPVIDTTVSDRIVFFPAPARSLGSRAEEVDDLFQAIVTSSVLVFRTRQPGDERRLAIHPYALVFHDGSLVLIGHVEELAAIRVFRFEDIAALERQERGFQVPPDFEVSAYLHGAFGVAPPTRTKLLVEFDARVADAVRAKKVHPAQRIAQAPDGRIRVSAPLGDRAAARAWILGFGDAARVLEPEDLVAEVKDSLVRAAARYGP